MVEPVAEILSPERLALANQFLKLFVFVLAGFVGYLVITRYTVGSTLPTASSTFCCCSSASSFAYPPAPSAALLTASASMKVAPRL